MKKEKGKSRIARFYELKKRPIIIVPETIEVGNISIHNIEKFLNEGVFDEKIRYENPHIAKTEFRHKLGNYNILF